MKQSSSYLIVLEQMSNSSVNQDLAALLLRVTRFRGWAGIGASDPGLGLSPCKSWAWAAEESSSASDKWLISNCSCVELEVDAVRVWLMDMEVWQLVTSGTFEADEGVRALAVGLSNSCRKSSSQVRLGGTAWGGVLDSATFELKTSLLKYSMTLIAQGEPLNKRSK